MHEGAEYQNRVRARACGLLLRDKHILLSQIRSPVTDELIWIPPGGGVELGESIEECLIREFHEETGLSINVGSFCFLNELIELPFHAIELYFRVYEIGGTLKTGSDPEHSPENQLLKNVQWFERNQLDKLNVVPRDLKQNLSQF